MRFKYKTNLISRKKWLEKKGAAVRPLPGEDALRRLHDCTTDLAGR